MVLPRLRRTPRAAWLVPVAALLVAAGAGCATDEDDAPARGEPSHSEGIVPMPASERADGLATRADERRVLVETLRRRGIRDARVLAAVDAVPRERFVPERYRREAYQDTALPIAHDQTISQPYIVALMTEALGLPPDGRVLEVGTGSGYQAAVLAQLTPHVWSIEIVEPLAAEARRVLDELDLEHVRTRVGDGYAGWPEAAPFDGILVTAAPDHVPAPLLDQLAVGGRLVIPVGEAWETQALLVLEKQPDGSVTWTRLAPVRFVPMTGEAEERDG